VSTGKQDISLELSDYMSSKSLTLSTDGALAAVGRNDGTVHLWDIAKKKRLGFDMKPRDKSREIMDLALTPDKKTLVTADNSGEVNIWQLSNDRKPMHTIAAHKQKIIAVVMSPDGMRFATVAMDNMIKLWDRASGRELRQWDLHLPVLTEPRPFVSALAFTPDGKQLATANADTTLYLLDCP
jgi:WD40 repeat protein